MAEVALDLKVRADGTSAVERAVNEVRKSFVELAAKAFVAQQAVTRAWRAMAEGAEAVDSIERLDRQMSRLGSSAQVMIGAMQRASGEQLTFAQSAQLAGRALALGFSPAIIADFTASAKELSGVMGTDIPTAFERLAEASASGSSRAFTQMGVYFDLEEELRKLALATGRTTEQISRQEKAFITAKAAAAAARTVAGGLAGAMVSDIDKLKIVEKAWTDLFDAIKIGSEKTVIELAPFFKGIADAMRFIVESGGQGFLGTGTLPTKGLGEPEQKPLPFDILLAQRAALTERTQATQAGVLSAELKAAESLARVQDDLVQRGVKTEEQALYEKHRLRVTAIDKQIQFQRDEMRRAEALHRDTLNLEGLTTEIKIAKTLEYETAILKSNEQIKELERDRAAASLETASAVSVAQFRSQEAVRQNAEKISGDMYAMQERRRSQDLQDAETYYQGLIELADARFESDAYLAKREQDLLREQLAFKLRITKEEADRLLEFKKQGNLGGVASLLGGADPLLSAQAKEGITSRAAAQDIRLAERASNNFFAGWARGMQQYQRDTTTGFGMAQDMARRTAQLMESNFQQFFFDPLKDGWAGVLDQMLTMTRQILAQIAAQLVTSQITSILSSLASAAGGFFGGSSGGGPAGGGLSQAGLGYRGFEKGFTFGASGAIGDYGRGTLAMLHGPEAVVPLPDGRSIPVAMSLTGGGGLPPMVTMPVTIINQTSEADVQARQTTNSNGLPQLEVLVTKVVNQSLSQGRMDKTLRSRFGLTPGER